MSTEEFIKVEEARSMAFNIFTALLCQPDEELLTAPDIYNTLEKVFEIINPESVRYVKQLQEAVKKYSHQELMLEFTKLFLGPFKVLAPPYSSIHFGSNMLMSEETVWAANFYKQAGLPFDRSLKDLPDHIAVETEFMYHLIYNELSELQNGNTEKAKFYWKNQSQFLSKHYEKWVPKFCNQIKNQTKNDFYLSLADFFSQFVSKVRLPQFPG